MVVDERRTEARWCTTLVMAMGWIASVGSLYAQDPLHAAPSAWGLATMADCTAPDGSTFTTEIVSLPGGSLRFVQVHASRRTEMLLVPTMDEQQEHSLARDPDTRAWKPAAEGATSFLRGHDVHRLYLNALEKLPDGPGPEEVTRTAPANFGGGEVAIRYSDPRPVIDIALPQSVDFLHDGERHHYGFRNVFAFRLLPGTDLPEDPEALFERLGDLHRIVALHAEVMQAHLDGDVEALIAGQASLGVTSGRGELHGNTKERTRERLGPYLESTTFERYADVVAPVVSISKDGTLAWLACQMEAEGVRRSESGEDERLEFGYTWVELYTQRDNLWLRTGNASSARR